MIAASILGSISFFILMLAVIFIKEYRPSRALIALAFFYTSFSLARYASLLGEP